MTQPAKIALVLGIVAAGAIFFSLSRSKSPPAPAVTGKPGAAAPTAPPAKKTTTLQPAKNPSTATPPVDLVDGGQGRQLPRIVVEWKQRIIEALTREGIDAAARLIDQTNDGIMTAQERGRLLRELAKDIAAIASPEDAAALVRKLPEGGDQLALATEVPGALAQKNPQAAAAFARAMEGNDFARNASQTAAREWSRTDMGGAVKWLNSLPNKIMQASAAEGIAATLASQDVGKALDWANQIEDPYLQGAVLTKAAKVLANRDPAAAAQWAANFPDSLSLRQSLGYAMPRWVAKDINAARQWAMELQNPAARLEALTALGTAWGAQDKTAASNWAAQLPEDARAQVQAAINRPPASPVIGAPEPPR